MAIETVQKTLRMPKELNIAVQEIACKKGLTFNAMVIEILWQYVEKKQGKTE